MTIDRIDESAQFVSAFFEDEMPKTAIILGSGLSALADQIEDRIAIPYSRIPHFAQSTAEGHKSNLIIGKLGGKAASAYDGTHGSKIPLCKQRRWCCESRLQGGRHDGYHRPHQPNAQPADWP